LLLLCFALLAQGCDRTVAATDVGAPEAPRDALDAASDEPAGDAAPEDAASDDAAEDRRFTLPDVEVEGVDVTTPDEGAVAFDVGPDCTVARVGGPLDDRVVCSPRRARPCTCADGRAGAETCLATGTWGTCACTFVDGGLVRSTESHSPVTRTPIPWIGRPRLLAPLSGTRVTSTRPTLRWLLPSGVPRARVELCADRACVRPMQQQEVAGSSWRAATALPPGVVFWRVRGLDAAGAVRWTSATWEFGVGRRDRGVDSSFGMLRDFNGDGFDDAVVSGISTSSSSMLLYPGSPTGIDERRVVELPLPPAAADDSRYGQAFSVGDVNGDGLADLAVGSPYTNPRRTAASLYVPGRVFLYLGHRTCTLAADESVYRLADDQTMSSFGWSVSIGGDFNGDGYSDMVATGISNGAQLHLGGPRGLAEAPADIALIARSAARFVGDINGDGYADIVLQHWRGADGPPGFPPFLVAYGNPEGLLGLQMQVLAAAEFGDDEPGHSARAGDFDEDGFGDVAVSGDGNVAVFHGSPDGLGAPTQLERRYSGPEGEPRGRFGGELAVGDFDGDGHLELAVSQPTAPAVRDPDLRYGPGMVHFFVRESGRVTLGARALFSITGSPPGGIGFGHPTLQGDLNGDGGDDLTIGAGQVGAMGMSQLWIYHAGVANWQRAPTRVFVRNYAFQYAE